MLVRVLAIRYPAAMTDTDTTLMAAARSALLIVDVQDRLAPAIPGADALVDGLVMLLRGARALDVPTVLTEHYVKGLGPTVAAVKAAADHAVVVEKIHFAATREPAFAQVLDTWRDRHVVIAGTEAHVCVMQTALGLRAEGLDVAVVVDAVGSRLATDRDTALHRLAAAGVRPVTVEMVLTEWLERGDHPAFKEMLELIKTRAAKLAGSGQ